MIKFYHCYFIFKVISEFDSLLCILVPCTFFYTISCILFFQMILPHPSTHLAKVAVLNVALQFFSSNCSLAYQKVNVTGIQYKGAVQLPVVFPSQNTLHLKFSHATLCEQLIELYIVYILLSGFLFFIFYFSKSSFPRIVLRYIYTRMIVT